MRCAKLKQGKEFKMIKRTKFLRGGLTPHNVSDLCRKAGISEEAFDSSEKLFQALVERLEILGE